MTERLATPQEYTGTLQSLHRKKKKTEGEKTTRANHKHVEGFCIALKAGTEIT